MSTVAVVGLGPAGRALAHRLLARGASVVVVDPAPARRWEQTYGGWAEQLPAWLPSSVVGAVPASTVIRARGEHRLPRDYVVLDTGALQESLSLEGADVLAQEVSDEDLPGLADVVVDCRGSRPGGLDATVPLQTAYGLKLEARAAAPLLDDAGAVLMDWRPYDDRERWGGEQPSFCYVIPLPDGRVLAEETCLAGRPAIEPGELHRRLLVRLERAGVCPRNAEAELVQIPLLAAPRAGNRFGTAGAQLNPFSGYSVFASLADADRAAEWLLTGGRLPEGHDRLRRVALEALLRLEPDATVELFEAFGRLSANDQRAVLDPHTAGDRLIPALGRQWARMRGRSALVRATTAGVAGQAAGNLRRDLRSKGAEEPSRADIDENYPRGDRKAVRPGEPHAPRVERQGQMWSIRAVEPARQVLRARDQTTQAGFTAEFIPQGRLEHRPVLISDGPVHDEQRRKVGRFFTHSRVERHLPLMEECADRLLAQAGSTLVLDDLALHYTVEVTAEVVGLTVHPPGDTPQRRRRRIERMSRRLVTFFNQPPFDLTRKDLGRTPWQWMSAAVNGLVPIARFQVADVGPAVRERRRQPADDVISHLVAEGYSRTNILIEAVTYGTAGMVTTREFICMAAWHLLQDDALRARYLGADREERLGILHEIIRLEPVVGHLYRRVTADLPISDGDQDWTIPAGDLVDICTRPANADARAVGEEPLRLCPGRDLPRGLNAAGLSFSDGPHRCPGQPLAILEADVLLTRLLRLNPVIEREPQLGWDDLIAGYWLRDFRLLLPDR